MKAYLLTLLIIFSITSQSIVAQQNLVRVVEKNYLFDGSNPVLANETYYAKRGNAPQLPDVTHRISMFNSGGQQSPTSYLETYFDAATNTRIQYQYSSWDANNNGFAFTIRNDAIYPNATSLLADSTIRYQASGVGTTPAISGATRNFYDNQGRVIVTNTYSAPSAQSNGTLLAVDSTIYLGDSTVVRSYQFNSGNTFFVRMLINVVETSNDTLITKSYLRTGTQASPVEPSAYTSGYSAFNSIGEQRIYNQTNYSFSRTQNRSIADAIAGNPFTVIQGQISELNPSTGAVVQYSFDENPSTGVRTQRFRFETYYSGTRIDSSAIFMPDGQGGFYQSEKRSLISRNGLIDSLAVHTANANTNFELTLTSIATVEFSTQYPSSLPNVFPQITSNELETEFLPSTIELSQNYPNPFNPSTQIEFNLQQAGLVRLTVYDLLGREVKTLVNRGLSAGTHTFTFDANGLSSGVYFYRLDASGQTLTRKMTLLK